MRKASSIVFEVIAGFFFYAVFLFAFIGLPHKDQGVRPVIVAIFSILAVGALVLGLALTRFHNWKRDTGIVLICAAAITGFVILMFASFSTSGEFPKTADQHAMTFIADYHYVAGGVAMAIIVALGLVLVITNKRRRSE